jgi:hypothetical protein
MNGERDLPPGWQSALISWANANDCISVLWLFGSRGPKGGVKPTSDVDVGLVLMPATGDHDWALGAYAAMQDDWQAELEAIVGRHVSMVPMVAGNKGDDVIRSTGICLWRRA